MSSDVGSGGRPRCPVHGVALPPDGVCVLCRKSAARSSRDRRMAFAGLAVVAIVFLAGGVFVAVTAMQRSADEGAHEPTPLEVALASSTEPAPTEPPPAAPREAESPRMAFERAKRRVRVTMYETPT